MGTKISTAFFHLFAACLLLLALLQVVLGMQLALLGGTFFYVLGGVPLAASGFQLFRRRISALYLAVICFFATWVWAIHEVGLDGWALIPRIDFVTIVALLFSLPVILRRLRSDRSGAQGGRLPRLALAGVPVWLTVMLLLIFVFPGNGFRLGETAAHEAVPVASASTGSDSAAEVQDQTGARFSALSQINRSNVAGLKRVWTFTRSPPARVDKNVSLRDEATPLEAAGRLFVCMADDTVVALDAENGNELWRYDPHVVLSGVHNAICRGVAYFNAGTTRLPATECDQRIILATLDARLIALSATTGRPCSDFGRGGEVSLRAGMGVFAPGQYYQTSPPAVVDGLAIVGGLVKDGDSTGEPSGVVRAFSARTGELVWAWDLGSPGGSTGSGPSEAYARGTPNVWSLLSVDPKLGLVYLPTGNATPDFVGSYRKPLWEKFASSLVALDVRTGRVRWSYQFVHHDLWDYDTSAQPVLFDMPTSGGMVPAVVEATKNGQLFVLDRRTGQALVPVVEKPVAQTNVPGEWTSRTQPFSIGMPDVAGPALDERSMWGLSPFDQILCRRKFRRLRYEGMFTPPSLEGSIDYPSQFGGVDWGSLSVDKARGLLIVPSTRLATVVRLAKRTRGDNFTYPQSGTPYGAYSGPFMTALGVPCQQPPYSMLTAIDLRTRKVVWERPVGTAEEIGPFGIASHLPLTIGAPPVVGGPLSTAGDVVFVGAFGDRRLRAIDSLNGRLLWSDKLPQGNQATPITYRGPRSGRQMVVIVSGGEATIGAGGSSPESVVAYALR
ncbi:MAG: membrane-bound PQQ-dependent dehydrogenase, glucose/quinate/shikimate family [Sphingomonadales bacterium]|nr:membrane-bound PQQ-dependent dehydrogenase, glucose/quinate/shikimate family [Sphingomonadales bacterium]